MAAPNTGNQQQVPFQQSLQPPVPTQWQGPANQLPGSYDPFGQQQAPQYGYDTNTHGTRFPTGAPQYTGHGQMYGQHAPQQPGFGYQRQALGSQQPPTGYQQQVPGFPQQGEGLQQPYQQHLDYAGYYANTQPAHDTQQGYDSRQLYYPRRYYGSQQGDGFYGPPQNYEPQQSYQQYQPGAYSQNTQRTPALRPGHAQEFVPQRRVQTPSFAQQTPQQSTYGSGSDAYDQGTAPGYDQSGFSTARHGDGSDASSAQPEFDSRSQKKGPKCWKCNEFGHKAKNCPEAKPKHNQHDGADRGQQISNAPMSQAPNVEQTKAVPKAKEYSAEILEQYQPHYQFPTEELTTDKNTALERVTQYAQSITEENFHAQGYDDPNAADVSDVKGDYGLRTGFNTEDTETKVVANYLPITIVAQPLRIFVYSVEMLREDAPNRRKELRGCFCKEVIFEQLRRTHAKFQSLRDNAGFWVTDYDTIWSVRELFVSAAGISTLPDQVLQLQGRDRSYRQFDVAVVTVDRGHVLDLNTHVSELFRNAVHTASNQDGPAVLKDGLNTIFTQFARNATQRTPTSANKFYWTTNEFQLDKNGRTDLQRTIRALSGYFASVRPSFDHLLLNVNTVTSPFFHRITVQEYADRLLNNLNSMTAANKRTTTLSANDERTFKSVMKGVRVTIGARIRGNFPSQDSRTRLITEIGKSVAQQPMRNGTGTVFSWFSTGQYATHPLQPALQRRHFSVNVGKPSRKNEPWNEEWYPASQLTIQEFQPIQGQLRSFQTDAMINYARKQPTENARLLTQDGIAMFGFNNTAGQTLLSNFGLSVNPSLIKFNARQLAPPILVYRHGNVEPKLAVWNLKESKFQTPADARYIRGLDLVDHNFNQSKQRERDFEFNNVLGYLQDALVTHGLPFSNSQRAVSKEERRQIDKDAAGNYNDVDTAACLNAACVSNNSDCNVIVLPFKADYDLYASIKRVAELDLGLKTLCVTYDNLRKASEKFRGKNVTPYRQLASNLALKCNVKGGGDNHHINGAFDPLFQTYQSTDDPEQNPDASSNARRSCYTIVIGADVAHALKTAAPGCPSIASVVGSVDDNFVKFPGSMRLQLGRKETIDKLWDMVKERLIDWAQAHGNELPKRILFYRDGVSESQYDKLIQEEMTQIHKAYKLAHAYLTNSMESCEESDRDEDDGYGFLNQPDEADELDAAHAANTSDSISKSVNKLELEDSTAQMKTSDGTGASAEARNEDVKVVTETKNAKKELTKADAMAIIRAGKADFQLTYVVVGKRHNTRFYAPSPNDTYESRDPATKQDVPNGNVKPGTVVDHTITDPYRFDFFLQSHQPIAGIGRSARYVVLANQMQLTAKQLQDITHGFCYIYAKATRGVSYCAPAYYADRLCDRGRTYLRDWLLNRGQQPKLDQQQREDPTDFKGRVMRHIYNSDYWRPHRNDTTFDKYGVRRRNPWHKNLDDIMFYL